jgi:hypothetical protein
VQHGSGVEANAPTFERVQYAAGIKIEPGSDVALVAYPHHGHKIASFRALIFAARTPVSAFLNAAERFHDSSNISSIDKNNR